MILYTVLAPVRQAMPSVIPILWSNITLFKQSSAYLNVGKAKNKKEFWAELVDCPENIICKYFQLV